MCILAQVTLQGPFDLCLPSVDIHHTTDGSYNTKKENTALPCARVLYLVAELGATCLASSDPLPLATALHGYGQPSSPSIRFKLRLTSLRIRPAIPLLPTRRPRPGLLRRKMFQYLHQKHLKTICLGMKQRHHADTYGRLLQMLSALELRFMR